MLYYLFKWLHEAYDFPGAGVFQYISFRAAMALILSLFISMIIGKKLIGFLRKKQVGDRQSPVRMRFDCRDDINNVEQAGNQHDSLGKFVIAFRDEEKRQLRIRRPGPARGRAARPPLPGVARATRTVNSTPIPLLPF